MGSTTSATTTASSTAALATTGRTLPSRASVCGGEAEGQDQQLPGRRVLGLADAGGSNSRRRRVWKVRFQALADPLGRRVTVGHLPPGTSKWHKIEHRLFAYIGVHWRGQPLVDYETSVSLIGTTTTTTGLTVTARLDLDEYPTGVTVSDAELASLALQPHARHPQWNYTLAPRPPPPT
jgi:Rhodopirellula transposase DDE domain